MHQTNNVHSAAWVSFSYASFAAAAFMVAIGIFYMQADFWAKGYLAMGIVMLVQTCVTLTKTIRDVHESSKLVNKIDEARTERLLMGVKGAA